MSRDEDIGNELGKGCLILVAIVVIVILLGIFAWHHFRFVA